MACNLQLVTVRKGRLERLECATDWIAQLEQSSRVVIDQYRVDQHADQILLVHRS